MFPIPGDFTALVTWPTSLPGDLKLLPVRGEKLFFNRKEVGHLTSAVKSPGMGNIAIGYVRREANQVGNELTLRTATGESAVKVVGLPFALE